MMLHQRIHRHWNYLMSSNNARQVRILPPEEARKIAAGEVVDRPAALVREFTDNAVDAGSQNIEVIIDGGGSRRVEVIDDGCGMPRDDLELCYLDHATSKIRCLNDLNTAYTLGFRGEALAAAAAVARVEILTSTDGHEAWRLVVGNGSLKIEQASRVKGTSIRAVDVFEIIPARKRFLKRDSSEGNVCKQAFIDKALAFPGIAFRFTQDDSLKYLLPAVPSHQERFAALVLERREMGAFLHEIGATGTGFHVRIVIGGPELSCSSRRQQYIFVNGRRIQDYALIQALEYGTQGWFPNSTHPVGGIFITIDPALADFNIHPAKREARFTNAGTMHHAITQALQDFVRHIQVRPRRMHQSTAMTGRYSEVRSDTHSSASLAMEALLTESPEFTELPGRAEHAAEPARSYNIRYAGKAFNLFLLVEKDDKLFIIDQHAAHERILYEKFLSQPIATQELLVAIPFMTESEEDDHFIEQYQEELALLGIGLEQEHGSWRITSLPANWHMSDTETAREILELKTAPENMVKRWAATLACHTAVKDGDYLDEVTIRNLVNAAFALPDPRCPHGRPIFFTLSRQQLFDAVHR
jgi:DNA mismatch repair protein MutL